MAIKLNEINEIVKRYNKKGGSMTADDFIDNAKRYIKAIADRRMVCSIDSVSRSGMSRNIKFVEVSKRGGAYGHSMLNFWALFMALDYTPVRDTDLFRISGCGMDMIFHTNYTIIGTLERLGFIRKPRASKLRQMTPHIV